MKNELEKLADKLASESLLILNLNKIKEANDWVIADGDRNVLEHEHDGQDVNDGGDGGEALALLLNMNDHSLNGDKLSSLNHASVKELIALRNELITTKV